MKVSPLAPSQAGNPGQNIGSIEITRSDTPTEPRDMNIRKIKMNTNATPGPRDYIEEQPLNGASQESNSGKIPPSSTQDPSEQAEGIEEATKPLSPQFAALAKQRRALQVKERELADREKALESKASPSDADIVARLKASPLSVLQEHGVTYDQLTEAILADQNGTNPEIFKLREEINSLKQNLDKTFNDRDTQQEQAALAEMRREAQSMIREGETFELIREQGKINEVMDLIHRTYKESGEVLDVPEALKLVENELYTESLKIANLKKVQKGLTPPAVPFQPQNQQQQRTLRTLTNRDNATPTMDRRQRALAAFSGNLKR